MTEEKEKQLFNRFKFFKPERPMNEALMCFGFSCGDGWFDLIWRLCEKIEDHLKTIDDNTFEVFQVKEKFGSLRFYTNWEDDMIGKYISDAEDESEITCEVCGKPGTIKGNYWLRCVCSEHEKKDEQ